VLFINTGQIILWSSREELNFLLESLNLLIIIYSVFNLNISKGLSLMDTRLIVIAAPVLVAASWALFNIGRLAIQQIQRLTR
jgi:hypothetical protein